MANRDSSQTSPADSNPAFSSPASGEVQAKRSALLIVFLVVFIDLLGFGIVLPLLPLYADEILEPLFPGKDQAALRGILLGLLMASFSFMQFLFAPVWGRVSDRIGRRPILLLGLAGSVVFYALFGFASEIGLGEKKYLLGFLLLFVARLGAGVAGATIATAQAVIADSTPPDRRARGMALIGAAFGIGFTFGPLLGFASLFLNLDGAPGFMAAGISLIALLLAIVLLPETLRTGSVAGQRRRFDWHGWQIAWKTPTVGLLIVTFFLATLAFGGLESTLALSNKTLIINPESSPAGETETTRKLTRQAARTTERSNFLIFAYVGFVLMLTQGLIYRRLVQRLGEIFFMRIGVVFMALGLAGAAGLLLGRGAMPRPTLLAIALLVMTIAVMGFAFLTPSVQSLISRRSDPAKQGEILGVNQSASALARILGPLIGLSLFGLTPSHVLPYAFGAALLVLVFLITLRIQPD
jgi:MFS family permease